MEEVQEFEGINITTLWLKNIFENLKNLEVMERNAEHGCQSIMEFANIPNSNREIELANIQYENLRFIITELRLLLSDIIVVKKELVDKYYPLLIELKELTRKENMNSFITLIHSARENKIIKVQTTQQFDKTLRLVSNMHKDIKDGLKEILFPRVENG